MTKKEAPQKFKIRLLEYFFNHLDNSQETTNLIYVFEQKGYNLEEFFWMDPQERAKSEDIRAFMEEKKYYGLKKETIENWLRKYEQSTK